LIVDHGIDKNGLTGIRERSHVFPEECLRAFFERDAAGDQQSVVTQAIMIGINVNQCIVRQRGGAYIDDFAIGCSRQA
jgi:hypothetical protein